MPIAAPAATATAPTASRFSSRICSICQRACELIWRVCSSAPCAVCCRVPAIWPAVSPTVPATWPAVPHICVGFAAVPRGATGYLGSFGATCSAVGGPSARVSSARSRRRGPVGAVPSAPTDQRSASIRLALSTTCGGLPGRSGIRVASQIPSPPSATRRALASTIPHSIPASGATVATRAPPRPVPSAMPTTFASWTAAEAAPSPPAGAVSRITRVVVE